MNDESTDWSIDWLIDRSNFDWLIGWFAFIILLIFSSPIAGNSPDDLFEYAEKARMVYFAINELRALDDEVERFLKTDDIRFSVGQSISMSAFSLPLNTFKKCVIHG